MRQPNIYIRKTNMECKSGFKECKFIYGDDKCGTEDHMIKFNELIIKLKFLIHTENYHQYG